MTDNTTLQMIIQGGAVGISLSLIAYTAWKDKAYNKTLNNHLHHFTEAMDRNSKVIGQNSETNNAVCKIIERIEIKLNKL